MKYAIYILLWIAIPLLCVWFAPNTFVDKIGKDLMGVIIGSLLGFYFSCGIFLISTIHDRNKEERYRKEEREKEERYRENEREKEKRHKDEQMRSLTYQLICEIQQNISIIGLIKKDRDPFIGLPFTYYGVTEFIKAHHLYNIRPEIVNIRTDCYIYEQSLIDYMKEYNAIKLLDSEERKKKIPCLLLSLRIIEQTSNALMDSLVKIPQIREIFGEMVKEMSKQLPMDKKPNNQNNDN